MLSSFIAKIFKSCFDRLDYSITSSNIISFGPYYSSLLYYYNNIYLSYFINSNDPKKGRKSSINHFLEKVYKNFSISKCHFPLNKREKELKKFFLNDYLKELMLNKEINYKVLYSFLVNCFPKKDDNNAYLLIFLLKEKWNINFKFKDNFSFKNDSKFFYGKFRKCLNIINNGNINIFISLLILRRTFPIIIKLLKFYLENHNKEDKDFISSENLNAKDEFQIYSYEDEKIWNCIREIDILDELKNIKGKKNIL